MNAQWVWSVYADKDFAGQQQAFSVSLLFGGLSRQSWRLCVL